MSNLPLPSQSNRARALEQLSNQLISTGFLRVPLPSNTFASGSIDGQESLLKAIFNLISSYHQEVKRRESFIDSQRQSDYEHGRLERLLESSQRDRLKADQNASSHQSKLSATLKALENEKASHKKTREEFQKLSNAERLVRSSCAQEIRKRSQEIEELQKRLNGFVGTARVTIPQDGISPSMVTCVVQQGQGRGGLLEFELQSAYRIRDQIVGENQELREYLSLYEQSILDLMGDIGGPVFELTEETEPLVKSLDGNRRPSAHLFKRLSLLTYELRERVVGLQTSLAEVVGRVDTIKESERLEREAIEEVGKARVTDLEREIERLKVSLAQTETVLAGWTQAGFDGPFGIMPNPDEQMVDTSILETLSPPPPPAPPQTTATSRLAEKKAETESRRRQEMEALELRQRQILEELKSPEPDARTNSEEPKRAGEDDTLESLVVFTKPIGSKHKEVINKKTSERKPKSSISLKNHGLSRLRRPLVMASKNIGSANLMSVLAVTGDEAGSSKSIPRITRSTRDSIVQRPSGLKASTATDRSQVESSTTTIDRGQVKSSTATNRTQVKSSVTTLGRSHLRPESRTVLGAKPGRRR